MDVDFMKWAKMVTPPKEFDDMLKRLNRMVTIVYYLSNHYWQQTHSVMIVPATRQSIKSDIEKSKHSDKGYRDFSFGNVDIGSNIIQQIGKGIATVKFARVDITIILVADDWSNVREQPLLITAKSIGDEVAVFLPPDIANIVGEYAMEYTTKYHILRVIWEAIRRRC